MTFLSFNTNPFIPIQRKLYSTRGYKAQIKVELKLNPEIILPVDEAQIKVESKLNPDIRDVRDDSIYKS